MNQTDHWDECPRNLLANAARRTRLRKLSRLVITTSGLSCAVALVAFGGWFVHLQKLQREYRFSGITCAEVRELLTTFKSGQLDQRRSEMLRDHVASCPNCVEFREAVQQNREVRLVEYAEHLATMNPAKRNSGQQCGLLAGAR